MSDSESPADLVGSPPPGNGEDLWGDDNLSDIGGGQEAGSDRDEDAQDRDDDNDDNDDNDDGGELETKTRAVIDVDMIRHRGPKPKDGHLRSLKMPKFFKVRPIEYDADTFEPTKEDLENSLAENPKHAIRWRRDPETGELQSNANYYKWSDGSVTIQVGDQLFEVQTKSLAQPSDKPYKEVQDAHYYAAAAHMNCNQFLVVGHVTEEYTVRPNVDIEAEAVQRLKAKLADLQAKQRNDDMIIRTTIDPELMKKEAEKAEKERDRDRRRRENAAARLDGVGRYGRNNTGFGDSERRAGGASRKRGGPGAQKQKRRRPEYDSDDDLPQGARRQDDYDLGDDFIAPSDEEVSEEADEEEEELMDDDDEEEEAPRRKRQKTAEAEDEDADGEEDDAGPSTGGGGARGGRRRIIDDDDEDE